MALQVGFADSVSAMIACYWKSMYQKLKEVNAWNVTVWRIMAKGLQSFITVWSRSRKFVYLTEEAEIVNAQRSDKDWYMITWNEYTNRVMWSLIIINVRENFKEGLLSDLIK